MHVGRVKAVDLGENRLIIEGRFHDRSFRDIPVTLEPDAPIIDPDLMNRTRAVPPEAVSFYNESPSQAVFPTPVIGMLGVIDDVRTAVAHSFKGPGDSIILLGKPN